MPPISWSSFFRNYLTFELNPNCSNLKLQISNHFIFLRYPHVVKVHFHKLTRFIFVSDLKMTNSSSPNLLSPDQERLAKFSETISAMSWLDGGHNGGKDTWITNYSILQVAEINLGLNSLVLGLISLVLGLNSLLQL